MQESQLGSLSNIRFMEDVKKDDRFYLRYYLTVKRARQLNEELYEGELDKSETEPKTAHSLRVACMTEQIKNQTIADYHMTWLVGLLHDTKEDHLIAYSEKIEDVLVDLHPEERKKVLLYIDQLTSEEWKSKGEKKEDQIKKMEILDLIPCWIRVFDKYDNCRRFKKNPVGNSRQKINGYCSIAYLCYARACERYPQIKANLNPNIHNFYQQIASELGGLEKVRQIAENYINSNK